MKLNLYYTQVWCLLFVCSFIGQLQAQSVLPTTPADQLIGTYLQEKYPTKSSQLTYRIEDDITDKKLNLRRVYVQQQYNGIDIKDAMLTLSYNPEGKRVSTDVLATDSKVNTTIPSIDPAQAIRAAMLETGDFPTVTNLGITSQLNNAEKYTELDKGDVASSDFITRLMFIKPSLNAKNYRLAWESQLYTIDKEHYWVVYTDAVTGNTINVRDLVLHCSFGEQMATDASPEEQAIIDEHRRKHAAEHAKEIDAYLQAHREVSIPVAERTFLNSTMMAPANTYRVLPFPTDSPIDGTATISSTVDNTTLGIVQSYTPNTLVDVKTAGSPEASPYGWTSKDGVNELPLTQGNNVDAFYDPSPGLLGGAPLYYAPNTSSDADGQLFRHNFDLTQEPDFGFTNLTDESVNNRNSAIISLFYANNMMHDIFYEFGFTEANRNFQFDNFGKGGLGNDHVLAQAQDGGGTNNANMLTLRDGVGGQMQMYLWTPAVLDDIVFLNDGIGGILGTVYQGKPGSFPSATNTQDLSDPANWVEDVPLAVINDGCGSDENNEGCGQGNGLGSQSCNDVSGKIAVIRRGSCSFVEKVQGADQSGALGVIVVNNVDGPPLSMGGTDATSYTIDIPSCMISKENGEALISKIQDSNNTLTGTMKLLNEAAPMRDGDFDNGVIAHEYGHGISNRNSPQTTTGGSLSGDEQGGEGWSDFWGLYITLTEADLDPAIPGIHPHGVLPTRGIGNYVTYQDFDGPGIRPQPYSIDMNINNSTYNTIANPIISAPHGVGFVWCTMLYELTQNMIDLYGFNDDLFIAPTNLAEISSLNAGGNNVANMLILEGIRQQPPSPTFSQQRDAILVADQMLYGGEHQCEIWAAFAKRGLGFSAESGTTAKTDQRERFNLPVECGGPDGILQVETSVPATTDNLQQMTYQVEVSSQFDADIPAVTLNQELPEGLSFANAKINGNIVSGVINNGSSVDIPIANIAGLSSVVVEITVNIGTTNATNVIFFDEINDANNWTATNVASSSTDMAGDSWQISETIPFGGATSWYVRDPDNFSNQTLDLNSGLVTNIPAGAEFSFWHNHTTEMEFDGGRVFINTSGTYEDLGMPKEGTDEPGNRFITYPYNDNFPVTNSPNAAFVEEGPMYGGGSGGYRLTRIDISEFEGESAQFRFQFGADVGTAAGGWAVDNVLVSTNTTYRTIKSHATAPTALDDFDSGTVLVVGETNNSLPIQLIDFQATANEDNIVLNWATANETNNHGFNIERRSKAETTFTKVGFVAATNELNNTYNFIDNDVKVGVDYFYRLRQIDNDAKSSYSPIRQARIATNGGYEVDLVPNPTTGAVVLNWTKDLPSNYEVEVISANGQVVMVQQVANGGAPLQLDLSNYPVNLYFVKINTEVGTITKKLMLKK